MSIAAPQTLVRDEIPDEYKWKLEHIFPDWKAWETACGEIERRTEEMAALQGTLTKGADALLHALRLSDELDQLAYKVHWYPSLMHDQDVRNNDIEGRRQRVGIVLSRAATACAWMNPEILSIPLTTVQEWMDATPTLDVYRFALEDLYRQQEHVLDESNERLLSYSAQMASTPRDAYTMLSTADMDFPELKLSDGQTIKLTHSKYHHILNTARNQEDRARTFRALYSLFGANANTYAALYNGVCQRDWFLAQARRYESTLEAALHGNNIPVSVVENLIRTTAAGVGPLRRYFRLRKQALGLDSIHPYDSTIPLVDLQETASYPEAVEIILESIGPLGERYRSRMERGFAEGWIDVYENEGKRSGAYSAPVYGVHPYMLLNYKDTLSDMFTLAHEMGHSMHTVLSHEAQPFVYSNYTIFVAEVASTLNEALLLDLLLARTEDPARRCILLQHAIDSIVGTFYTQVLFADFELRAHRLVEQGEPITATVLNSTYHGLLQSYYGDDVELDQEYELTWARIPHFFRSPYYVYQYATCFASAAKLKREITADDPAARKEAVDRYLALLGSGSSDHPMAQLQRAGVDLSEPTTVQAVIDQCDDLVGKLEQEVARLH